jgi:hypothetical protein
MLRFIFTLSLLFSDTAIACSWLADNGMGPTRTDSKITRDCDRKSFKVLNYYLAIDKNHVYCKPTPNATNLVIRIENADPKTFHLLDESHSADRKCSYQFCQILKCKRRSLHTWTDHDTAVAFKSWQKSRQSKN